MIATPFALTAAAASAVAATALGGAGRPPATSGFGGPRAVRIVHVGGIDTDVEATGHGALRRIACAGGTAATACFVARRSPNPS